MRNVSSILLTRRSRWHYPGSGTLLWCSASARPSHNSSRASTMMRPHRSSETPLRPDQESLNMKARHLAKRQEVTSEPGIAASREWTRCVTFWRESLTGTRESRVPQAGHRLAVLASTTCSCMIITLYFANDACAIAHVTK